MLYELAIKVGILGLIETVSMGTNPNQDPNLSLEEAKKNMLGQKAHVAFEFLKGKGYSKKPLQINGYGTSVFVR